MFNLKMLNVFKRKYKIGPIAGTDWEANSTNSEVIVNNAVFAIEIDGVISDDLETGPESNNKLSYKVMTFLLLILKVPNQINLERSLHIVKYCVNVNSVNS